MPELPDVEAFRKYFDSTSLHQRIERVEVNDDRVLEDVSPAALGRGLRGKYFGSTRRRGKHLFAETGADAVLALHFGMTGYLKYYERADADLDHDRVVFHFGGGGNLAYVCQRMIGRLRLAGSAEELIEELELGPDALHIGREAFTRRIGSKRGGIKSALMDQRAMAGVGNVYADEILLHARTDPGAKVKKLSAERLGRIHGAMKSVLEQAAAAITRNEDFPDSFLVPRREQGAPCPVCDGEIEKTEVSGRSTYFCPSCQRP